MSSLVYIPEATYEDGLCLRLVLESVEPDRTGIKHLGGKELEPGKRTSVDDESVLVYYDKEGTSYGTTTRSAEIVKIPADGGGPAKPSSKTAARSL